MCLLAGVLCGCCCLRLGCWCLRSAVGCGLSSAACCLLPAACCLLPYTHTACYLLLLHASQSYFTELM